MNKALNSMGFTATLIAVALTLSIAPAQAGIIDDVIGCQKVTIKCENE